MNMAAKLRMLLARPQGRVTAAQAAALMGQGAILVACVIPASDGPATPPGRGISRLPSLPSVSVSCRRAARW
jgi:hypothetical protein